MELPASLPNNSTPYINSTMLAALFGLKNDTFDFMELEDPVEYVHNVAGPSETVISMMELSKVFHYISAIIGIAGNLLVIICYLKYSKLRTILNTYLVNLAISDLIYVITVPLFLLSMWHNSWPLGDFICKLLLSKGAIHRFASSLFLAVLAADRYLAICKPQLSHDCYKKASNVKVICCITWLVAAFAVSPIYFNAGTFTIPGIEAGEEHPFSTPTPPTVHCELLWSGTARISYIWFTIILAFVLPTIAKAFFAIPLIYTLTNTCTIETGSYQVLTERNKRITYFVLTIILAHFVLWLPLWISLISINMMPPYMTPDNATLLLHLLSGCIGMANTVINPILYFRLSPEFGDALSKLVKFIPDGSGSSSNGGANGIVDQERSVGVMEVRRDNGTAAVTKFDSAMSGNN